MLDARCWILDTGYWMLDVDFEFELEFLSSILYR
jgi:hypothetical protein